MSRTPVVFAASAAVSFGSAPSREPQSAPTLVAGSQANGRLRAVSPNTLVRFDPRSQKFPTWPIPSGGGVVRNMMPTHDSRLVLAESGADKVALVDVN